MSTAECITSCDPSSGEFEVTARKECIQICKDGDVYYTKNTQGYCVGTCPSDFSYRRI